VGKPGPAGLTSADLDPERAADGRAPASGDCAGRALRVYADAATALGDCACGAGITATVSVA
jgi:hypothetical protein